MKYNIIHRPSFSLVEVELEAGESIKAEPWAMVSMSENIQVETATGGVFKALGRVLGGERLFMNTFYADGGPGTIELCATIILVISKPLNLRVQFMLRVDHT